jgi:hypothetical protein
MTPTSASISPRTRSLLNWAALFSIITSIIHGAAFQEHLTEWWGYAMFFVTAMIVQGIYGLILFLRPWKTVQDVKWMYLSGIVGNAAIILLYLITRTVGIPFLGPEAGQVEDFTAISLLAKISEVIVIGLLAVLLRNPSESVSG